MFYYGAQYYRPPNPRDCDWEQDMNNMKKLGFNIVKIWAMWNCINPRENEYDFRDFDRLFELAQKNNLQVVVSLILENAPYWLREKHPDSR